jgi:vacuolar-type H+-ATPase subunit I/STV1
MENKKIFLAFFILVILGFFSWDFFDGRFEREKGLKNAKHFSTVKKSNPKIKEGIEKEEASLSGDKLKKEKQNNSDNFSEKFEDEKLKIEKDISSESNIKAGEKQSSKKCIYNQAYIENFSADKVSEILKEARDCYVLLDLSEEKAQEKVLEIKKNKNIISCYTSVGTAED